MLNQKSLYVPFSFSLLLIGCGGAGDAAVEGLLDIPTKNSQDQHEQNIDPALLMSEAEIRARYSGVSCDPLDNGGQEGPIFDDPNPPGAGDDSDPDYTSGLRGTLRVAPQGDSGFDPLDWQHLDRFLEPDAKLLNSQIYVSQLSVPAREFSEGFPTLDGDFVRDDEGLKLDEFFRIDFEGTLRLPEGFDSGAYEFALLSDDGVRLFIGDAETPLASFAAETSTRLVCGSQPKTLNAGTNYPVKVEYYQGPRYHIALMLLWRKASHPHGAEAECGNWGWTYWFDPFVTPFVAKAPFEGIIDRDWRPVPKSAFEVPVDEPLNPCLSPRVQEVLGK